MATLLKSATAKTVSTPQSSVARSQKILTIRLEQNNMEQLLPISSGLIFLIAAWTLPWKGVALWKAAKLGDKRWFIAILVINTLAILDIIYIFFISRRQSLKNKIL